MEVALGTKSEAEVDALASRGYPQKKKAPDVSGLASQAGASRGLGAVGCVTNWEVAVD